MWGLRGRSRAVQHSRSCHASWLSLCWSTIADAWPLVLSASEALLRVLILLRKQLVKWEEYFRKMAECDEDYV